MGESDAEFASVVGKGANLTNASYFAFTATPQNKTLEMFGEAQPPDAQGRVKRRPLHRYTMKQAIQQGFILDEPTTGYTCALVEAFHYSE